MTGGAGMPVHDRDALRAADEAARRSVRTEFARPIILEAGAGTGKTTTLVARVLAWMIGPGWDRAALALAGSAAPPATGEAIAARAASRVVAITFTERAAAEMAAKIAHALQAVVDGGEADGLPRAELPAAEDVCRARAAWLLAASDRIAVGTIHGFCRALLARWPLEAGVHPAFEVDGDGTRLASAVADVLAEHVATAFADPPHADDVALAAAGFGPVALAEHLQALTAQAVPPEALAVDPLAPSRMAPLLGTIARETDTLLAGIAAAIAGGKGQLASARETIAALAGVRPAVGAALAAALAAEEAPFAATRAALHAEIARHFTSRVEDRLSEWARTGFNKTESAALGAEWSVRAIGHCAALHEAFGSLRAADPGILGPARRVLHGLLARVHERLRARGFATFEALLDETARLLDRDPGVARAVRTSYDQVLVDEIQDTDPRQYRILSRLALDGPEDERPGFLVVGDPKQLIYSWRAADLAAYERFVEQVRAEGGTFLRIAVNFRSVPAILDEVERAIGPAMIEEPGIQPAFTPLLVSDGMKNDAGCTAGGRAPVEYWISWDLEAVNHGQATGAGAAREIEARAVARDIAALHAEGTPLGHFALLLRATSGIDTYLQALRTAGLPFVVERDRNYFRRREVIDAAALVRLLIDPHDQLALVTVLRAPWAAIPDAALLPLWARSFPQRVVESFGPETAAAALAAIETTAAEVAAEIDGRAPGLDRIPHWPRALVALCRALAELSVALRREAPDRFVERLRALLLVEEIEARRGLGAHRLANLERFFRELAIALAGQALPGERGLHGLLRALREGVAGLRDEEEGALGDETLDAVRVLTVHKAKGLTFEQVYAVDLHHKWNDSAPDGPVAVFVDGQWEFRLCGAATPGLLRHERARAAHARAEEIRTLYVAMTRPRRRLVLAGCWPRGSVRSGEPPRCALDVLAGRAGIPETNVPGDVDPEAGIVFDASDGVRWLVPGRGSLDDLAPATAPPEPFDAAQAERDADRLAAAREAARERAARPLLASPSALAHEALERVFAGAGPPDERAQAIALGAGTAVHRAFEEWDASADVEAELARQRAALASYVPAGTDDVVDEAARRAAEVLDAFGASPLLARFAAIRHSIIGRELPMLLSAEGLAGAGGPSLGAYGGTIDMLYRDPANGAHVVVDYKTDRVAPGPDLDERAGAYAVQGMVYARAVQAALGGAVRFELWFLRAGVVTSHPVPRAGAG